MNNVYIVSYEYSKSRLSSGCSFLNIYVSIYIFLEEKERKICYWFLIQRTNVIAIAGTLLLFVVFSFQLKRTWLIGAGHTRREGIWQSEDDWFVCQVADPFVAFLTYVRETSGVLDPSFNYSHILCRCLLNFIVRKNWIGLLVRHMVQFSQHPVICLW